jgi:hypothetical protein
MWSGAFRFFPFLGAHTYTVFYLSKTPEADPQTSRKPHKMQWKPILAALAAAQLATAQELMRFGCSQLTFDRIDPLVNPGSLPSPHMHQLIGGNSLNVTMEPVEHDPPSKSTCTSCTYSEDFSNYWTANVYFKARNGTFKLVPLFTNLGLNVKGGMTVY